MTTPFKSLLATVEASRSVAAKKTLAGLAAIKAARQKAIDTGRPPDVVKSTVDQLRAGLAEDIILAADLERRTAGHQLDELRRAYTERYRRDWQSHQIDIDQAARRFRAMTQTELEAEAQRFMTGDGDPDPAIADELGAALRGTDVHPVYREVMVKRRYDDPVIHAAPGAEIHADLEFMSSMRGDTFMVKMPDGRRMAVGLDEAESWQAALEAES